MECSGAYGRAWLGGLTAGYGPNPPDARWPSGTRLALNFVVTVEEGCEASVSDGDGRSESGLTELAGADLDTKGRDLAAEEMFEYGSRVGLRRVMRLLQDRGVKLTVFGCASALERNPSAARRPSDPDSTSAAPGCAGSSIPISTRLKSASTSGRRWPV